MEEEEEERVPRDAATHSSSDQTETLGLITLPLDSRDALEPLFPPLVRVWVHVLDFLRSFG